MSVEAIFKTVRAVTQECLGEGPAALAATSATSVTSGAALPGGSEVLSPFMIGLTVFALACFVGYYVVWRVTPALHSPLMAVTNAVSSVIIVGALIACGGEEAPFITRVFGFIAVTLASINIFGGFAVTDRMLKMFRQ